ncbi:hypothetical protein ABBQ32_009526 [Trebouxia sp. C0010 RCD-2024]
MAAMEPNEWCWQNSRQYPVQELLDRLSQVHILKGANARKAMIFFSWSTEQQQHAQAAAKQAKKQRQKAKKRQDKINKQALKVPQDLPSHQGKLQAPQQEAPKRQTAHQQTAQQQMTQQQISQQQAPQQQAPQLQLTPHHRNIHRCQQLCHSSRCHSSS